MERVCRYGEIGEMGGETAMARQRWQRHGIVEWYAARPGSLDALDAPAARGWPGHGQAGRVWLQATQLASRAACSQFQRARAVKHGPAVRGVCLGAWVCFCAAIHTHSHALTAGSVRSFGSCAHPFSPRPSTERLLVPSLRVSALPAC